MTDGSTEAFGVTARTTWSVFASYEVSDITEFNEWAHA